jgi:hypothetical protein
MARPTDAVITGFAHSRVLAEQSLASVRQLRQEGLLRRVACVTWDTPETHAYAGWVEDLGDVELARVPQPAADGTSNQRGVVFQVENLRAALTLVADGDDLVLKLRPDFVADAAFLRSKVQTFDVWSALPARSIFGVTMPKPVLGSKIWLPWADSNQPFFYEDAAFLGRKRDLQRLVTRLTGNDAQTLGDDTCKSFAHVVRYAKPFLGDYPLFARYLRDYRFFADDLDYRLKLVPYLLNDGFFWHMLMAHAWVLHSHFHVDAGQQGELRFYANTVNRQADWSNFATLNVANPYDKLEMWRTGTRSGEATGSVQRAYGRLVDDAWQRALFTRQLPDFPRKTLVRLLENIAGRRDDRLSKIEGDFYRGLKELHVTYFRANVAAAAR